MTNVLAKKAMLVTLAISAWGVRRLDKEAAYEVMEKHNAEKHVGLFTKRLLNKQATENIRSIRGTARAYHKQHTQPWMDDGTRILPSVLYLEYTSYMQKRKEEFHTAVKEFVKEYPRYVQQAKKELGSLFNENDYPTAKEVQASFDMDIVFYPCPSADDFRVSLDAADMAELKKDLEDRMQQQLNKALKDIGTRIADVVGHMVARLKEYKPANNAKGIKASNTFRDSLVSNVQELANLIPAFNLSGDKALDKIHKRLLKELCSTNANVLREDTNVRKTVAKSAQEILDDINAFMA